MAGVGRQVQGPLADRPGARHPGVRHVLREGVAVRAGTAAGLIKPSGSTVIIKAIGPVLRGAAAIRSASSYAGRLAEQQLHPVQGWDDPGALRDASGELIEPADLVDALRVDEETEPAARHLVVSLPGSAEQVQAVVAASLRETFLAWDVPVAWAVHTDHSEHPHAHIIIGARLPSAAGGKGAMLPFAPDGRLLDGLRAVLARWGRASGLDVSSERSGDRSGWQPLDRVTIELRAPGKRGRRRVVSVADPTAARFAVAAPHWWARFGSKVWRQLGDQRAGQSFGEASVADLPKRWLQRENPALASWLERCRPDLLSEAPDPATPIVDGRDDQSPAIRRSRAARERELDRLTAAILAWEVGVDGVDPLELARLIASPALRNHSQTKASRPERSRSPDR